MSLSFALPNGRMPAVGYGCWKIGKDTAADLIEKVIRLGYRHIDGASDYANEKEVGQGIKRAIDAGVCKREDLFVTSKLWNTFHAPEHVEEACQKSLDDLGLEYLDLYLIHFPISLKYVPIDVHYPPEWINDPTSTEKKMELVPVPVSATWQAMEGLVEKGLVKNIGLSNWNAQGLRDIFSYAKIKPSVLQIEIHPYLQCDRLVSYAQSLGMVVTAFSPLGHGQSYAALGYANSVAIKEETILEIAERLGVTPAQVVLRWGIQRGYSVIPKSENEGRIKENLSVEGFKLSEEDMEKIKSLEKNFRMNDPGLFCPLAFNTPCPIWD
eukprot:GFUD01137986.1.p1 GENE.GFUD01137986.1~~GFUD01137986.1.p1  ORF type:complete len:325 (-),score=73.88 GFUD01137986.1:187-1161(-)